MFQDYYAFWNVLSGCYTIHPKQSGVPKDSISEFYHQKVELDNSIFGQKVNASEARGLIKTFLQTWGTVPLKNVADFEKEGKKIGRPQPVRNPNSNRSGGDKENDKNAI